MYGPYQKVATVTQVGITLTDWELAVCEMTAEHRHRHWRSCSFEEQIVGCKSELAVAKAFNIYWHGFDNIKEADRIGDVGKFQVKGTTHNDGHLIFQDKHRETQQTILGVVGTNKVRLCGWLHFSQAKLMVSQGVGKKQWRNDQWQCWAYWIPQTNLESMEWLPVDFKENVVAL